MIASEIGAKLRKQKCDVRFTREKDVEIDFEDKMSIGDKFNKYVFLSIGIDYVKNNEKQSVDIIYSAIELNKGLFDSSNKKTDNFVSNQIIRELIDKVLLKQTRSKKIAELISRNLINNGLKSKVMVKPNRMLFALKQPAIILTVVMNKESNLDDVSDIIVDSVVNGILVAYPEWQ